MRNSPEGLQVLHLWREKVFKLCVQLRTKDIEVKEEKNKLLSKVGQHFTHTHTHAAQSCPVGLKRLRDVCALDAGHGASAAAGAAPSRCSAAQFGWQDRWAGLGESGNASEYLSKWSGSCHTAVWKCDDAQQICGRNLIKHRCSCTDAQNADCNETARLQERWCF